METIEALNKLEQAGKENSKATRKLHEAASELASAIEQAVPVGVELPKGYIVKRVRSNVGDEVFLVHEETGDWIDGIGTYLHGDFHCEIPAQSRGGSLIFARDIRLGLLDEIAAWLEERTAKAEEATAELLRALPKAKELSKND